MIVLMGMTSISIALTVLVLNLHHRGDASAPPAWLSALVPRTRAPLRSGAAAAAPGGPSDSARGDAGQSSGSWQTQYSTSESYRYEMSSVFSMSGAGGSGGGGGGGGGGGAQSFVQHQDTTASRGEDGGGADGVVRWRDLAAALDTLFFWAFLLVTVVVSLIILLFVPLTKPIVDKVAESEKA